MQPLERSTDIGQEKEEPQTNVYTISDEQLFRIASSYVSGFPRIAPGGPCVCGLLPLGGKMRTTNTEG